MENREGGVIVKVYIIFFFCKWWNCSDELGEGGGEDYPFQDTMGAAYHVPCPGTTKIPCADRKVGKGVLNSTQIGIPGF